MMPDSLCVTIRFLQPVCHGRGDQGEPEWPPSPLRVFQSLVAASAARWNERERLQTAAPALKWLERQPPPLIVAPRAEPSQVKYRLYVPDNVADKVAGSWSRDGSASIADYRTEKDVRPTNLLSLEDSVHFLWRLSDSDHDIGTHKEVLFAAARSITHLGWGIDMVVANASIISDAGARKLPGERWRPTVGSSATGYRVPIEGTLDALVDKHRAFLNRITPEGFHPVPPLSKFNVVEYLRATEAASHRFAAFSLLKPDASGFRSFDNARDGIAVAAMIRHLAGLDDITAALGWSPEKVASFVLGHGEARGEPHVPIDGPRLAFVPVPSIEPRGKDRAEVVGRIRRAMIVVLGGQADANLRDIARLLSGAQLQREGQSDSVAMLSRIPDSDNTIRRYTTSSTSWATVTPVILPGYDDPRKLRKRLFALPHSGAQPLTVGVQKELLGKLDRRIDYLLRKAIRQAGFSEELSQHAVVEWRAPGFWPGTELATRYLFAEKHRRFRRLHVRINWRDNVGNPISIPGPICLGGGRFQGLGLFAAPRGF
jgi:CRISPR-associated protein Csb2